MQHPEEEKKQDTSKKFKENTHDNEVVKKTTMREMKMLSMHEYENLDILKDALKR